MAHHTEQTGFPNVPLKGGMILRLRALDPAADSEVSGVTCTQWAIYGRDKSAGLPLEDAIPEYIPGDDPEP